MRLSLIVAVSENGVIGRDGDLPWRLPADLRRFKKITMGHAIVMGRKTYESIGRPLPGRTSVVLTKTPGFVAPREVIIVGSLDEALERLSGEDEVFVIGGRTVFEAALPRVETLYLTLVNASVEGNVFAPEDLLAGFELVEEERHPADEKHAHAFSFRVYRRA